MFKWLWVLIFCLAVNYSRAQGILQGRVYEDKTKIGLSDVFIENITNKKSAFTDQKGRFSIPAKTGDVLTFKGVAYRNDTVLVTGMQNLEVFMEAKTNQLAQVNVTTTEIKKFSTYDKDFHGQTVVYHRDRKGYLDGGITIRMHWWKKDEHKKAKLAKRLKDFDTMDEIAAVFSEKNLTKYVPLTGQDMENFISLYRPDVKTYTQSNFDLIAYLNKCYQKYKGLSPKERQANTLKV